LRAGMSSRSQFSMDQPTIQPEAPAATATAAAAQPSTDVIQPASAVSVFVDLLPLDVIAGVEWVQWVFVVECC
jgi:hypothetical protein